MIKKIAIVSLSSGTIGEGFVKHEVDLGIQRLEALGAEVCFMPHALAGIEYVKAHPEKRAEDLLAAFRDDSVDMILCAIGGDDTYRLLPYLFGRDELKQALQKKVFLGFSDTTINHLMLHKLGLVSFYGQSFLADVCEMEREMLPYSAQYLQELVQTGRIAEIHPSELWYEERTDYSPEAMGTPRVSHPNGGFELLQGPACFSGRILGGCADSLYDLFETERYPDTVELCEQYGLFPPAEDWQGRILLLETSEERLSPEKYRKLLLHLKRRGVLDAISGILCGRPIDEQYIEEYKQVLVETVADPALPIVWNLSIGHACPRCILPFGIPAVVDTQQQSIRFLWND